MGLMKRKSGGPENVPSRENHRYTIPLPMKIEIHRGVFKRKEFVVANPVDLAIGGAACHVPKHDFFSLGRRFRVYIDGTACFAEVRNIRPVDGGLIRVGMSFIKLELETQERIVDAIDQAKFESSRINPSN